MSRISNVINQAPFYKCLELKAEIEKLKAAQSSQNIDWVIQALPARNNLLENEAASAGETHGRHAEVGARRQAAAPGCPGS